MITADAVRERWRYQAAAARARRAHPGPLGELVYRELTAYAEFGHQFGHDGLLSRLVDDLLAGRADGCPDGGEQGPARGADTTLCGYISSAIASAARAAPPVSTGR